jgi:hypothetical protein
MANLSGRQYFYAVGLQLKSGAWATESVKTAFSKVAQAYRDQPNSLRYATYRSLAGRGASLHGLIGLRDLKQIEAWPKRNDVVKSAYGEHAANILEDYDGAWSHARRVIMKYRPEFSNPQDYDQPPRYLYYVEAQIQPQAGSEEVLESVSRVVGAHRTHRAGRGYVTYSQVAGHGRPTFYGFSGLNSLAELNDRVPQRTIVRDAYGKAEGDRHLAAYHSYITIRTTMILEYVPELSNFTARS